MTEALKKNGSNKYKRAINFLYTFMFPYYLAQQSKVVNQ